MNDTSNDKPNNEKKTHEVFSRSKKEQEEKDASAETAKSTKAEAESTEEIELGKIELELDEALEEDLAAEIDDDDESNVPAILGDQSMLLPVVPIREGVLFPSTESVLTFGRQISREAIEESKKTKDVVVLLTQKKSSVNRPKADDLYQIGTLAVVERRLNADGKLNALVKGVGRVRVDRFVNFRPHIKAVVTQIEDKYEDSDREEIEALASHLQKLFRKAVHLGKPVEFLNFMKLMSGVTDGELVDQIASTLNLATKEKQEVLSTTNVRDRLELVIELLSKELKVLEIEKDVASKTQEKFDKTMRENVLRERMRTIQKELGEFDDEEEVLQDYQERLADIEMPDLVKEKIEKEMKRMKQMSPNNPESGYIRSWLDTMFDMPWGDYSADTPSLKRAKEILDEGHHGLDDVKDRVLEFIAVLKLKQGAAEEGVVQESNVTSLDEAMEEVQKEEPDDDAADEETLEVETDTELEKEAPESAQENDGSDQSMPTILCFVGPPGVGKTSIGKSIARALGREFVKVSLGGVRDEAEIRGHRRTYVGAMPGRIINGIKQAGTMDPVFMMDEIDKVGSDFRGDPSAALLEALDPEQNDAFEDHYLDVPFDLSDVLFITTANTLDTIPPALRDRLEIVRYAGYTSDEKFQIAKNHLLEKIVKVNGLKEDQISMNDEIVETVIDRYTREAGVRTLERTLSKVARKVARKMQEDKVKSVEIDMKTLKDFLGPEKYDPTMTEEEDQVGLATGLAYTAAGGDALFIEVALTPGKGKIKLTGKLGDVMKESAQAALTYVQANAETLGIDAEKFDKTDVHIHVPEGAVPKDGPSAGITITTAITSAFTERAVKNTIAMTGEVTLRGRVLRIGGLKEKSIAALRAGAKTVLIPQDNERDLVDVPDQVKDKLKFIPVEHMDDVLKHALVA